MAKGMSFLLTGELVEMNGGKKWRAQRAAIAEVPKDGWIYVF